MSGDRELFQRHPANPILTAAAWPYAANAVFDSAAALVDEETVLLTRVEEMRGISHLTVARAANGIDGWRIEARPLFAPEAGIECKQWGSARFSVDRMSSGSSVRWAREAASSALCRAGPPEKARRGVHVMHDISDEIVDQLLEGYRDAGELTGPEELINRLRKRLIERAVGVELSQHLGYVERLSRRGRS